MPPASSHPFAVQLMRRLGFEPDPWQMEVLESPQRRLLLNCCRQAGKSTVVAVLGLAEALFVPFSMVLLLAPSHRQSRELFHIIRGFYRRLKMPLRDRENSQELELTNHSRVICLPCREDTIRCYASVTLLVIDEAARVPDDLFHAVQPMLAVTNGRLICLSTPRGRRGFFYEAWDKGGDLWQCIEIPVEKVSRISAEFLEATRRTMSASYFRQEFNCSFEALEGLVYPDFARCVVPGPAPTSGQKFGGIDFGFRNPFAALWGILDRDDVLWLTGEHYASHRPLFEHVKQMPRDVSWYCDPASPQERIELILAGLTVRAGLNPLALGIQAVTTRLEQGRLRVVKGSCPDLLHEATLYRYDDEPTERSSEVPLDRHNHAMAALRYLIATMDSHRMARPRIPVASTSPTSPAPKPPPMFRSWQDLVNDPNVWTSFA